MTLLCSNCKSFNLYRESLNTPLVCADCKEELKAKSVFRVGDVVIAVCPKDKPYGITCDGWRGIITDLNASEFYAYEVGASPEYETFGGLEYRYFILEKECKSYAGFAKSCVP